MKIKLRSKIEKKPSPPFVNLIVSGILPHLCSTKERGT